MAEKERITNPTMGSNQPGSETPETRGSGMPAGTNTQTIIAAQSAQKKKEEDEAKEKNLPIERPDDLPASESQIRNSTPGNISRDADSGL